VGTWSGGRKNSCDQSAKAVTQARERFDCRCHQFFQASKLRRLRFQPTSHTLAIAGAEAGAR